MDKISIVVPIYKVEKYIRKCVNSILNQTYKNIEVILVDDGSPDNCPDICDEYAKRDNRIKVIHKNNGGLSDARNKGIECATGKYISFIDSDDYIKEDMIEVLYKNIKKYNADISICDYLKINEDNDIKIREDKEVINEYNSKEAIRELVINEKIENYAWNKLYDLRLFKDIKYPSGKKMEDLGTTYLLFLKSNNIVVSNKQEYYYLNRKGSILNNLGNDFIKDKIDLYFERYKELKKIYPDMNRMDKKANQFFWIHFYKAVKDENIEILKFMKEKKYYQIFLELYKSPKKLWLKSDIKSKIKIILLRNEKKI